MERMAEIVPATMEGHAARAQSFRLAMCDAGENFGELYGQVLDAVQKDIATAGGRT